MTILITGGAGFVGSNAAAHLLAQGRRVIVLDNLGRRGTDKNLAWLRGLGGDLVFSQTDIRDAAAVTQPYFGRTRTSRPSCTSRHRPP